MYTRWRLYILAVFIALAALLLLTVRFARRRGMEVSRFQAALFVAGMLLIAESILISRLSNWNLGVILPAFFGAPLVFLAVFLPKLRGGFPGFLKWFIAGCYGVAGVIFLICGILMLSSQRDAEKTCADGVIVLGAAVHGDRVTWVLENRLKTAAQFMECNPEAVCVVSGGQGAGESVTEASAMKKYLVEELGIAPERVYTEEKATSTVENFRFSVPILREALGEDASLAFVTTDFHVYRAGRVARAQGVEAQGISAPDVWYLKINNFMRECVGICVYALTGRF